jgi:hypothetical protein
MSAKTTKNSICLNLRNGNIVTGISNLEKVVFKTNYGELIIPINDIQSIDFGLISSIQIKNKVEALLDLLQNSNEIESEKFFKKLIEVEITALPILEAFLDDDQCAFPEFGVEAIIEAIKSKYNVQDYITEDIVSLASGDYKMPGETNITEIELNTEFGALQIPRDKIISAEILPNEDSEIKKRTYKIEANKHISGNVNGGWLKTNVKLNKGQKFTIKAKGEVSLASLSNQIYKPDGSYKAVDGNWSTGNNSDFNAGPIFGNLIYKIGEGTAMYKVGTKLSTKAYSSGVLYISIFETVYNTENSGFYSVEVSA